MNKLIENELRKCKGINIPYFDSNTKTLTIKKHNVVDIQQVSNELQVGHVYRFTVEDYIVHPYEGFSLHDNWNNGIIPDDINMAGTLLQIMGKMVKVNIVGINTNTNWVGWIPIKSIVNWEEIA